LSKTKPNTDYLSLKLGFTNLAQAKHELLTHCESLDFEALTRDVEIFLFDASGKNNITYFPDIIRESL